MEADLQAERQAHRQTQARLIVAESQLQDAIGVRIDQQLADRVAAERQLKMIEQYAARLREELTAAQQETEKLREQAERNQRRDAAPSPGANSPPPSTADTD
jgi:CO dehydrogenase/acetyl-CoA synthase beta subunit